MIFLCNLRALDLRGPVRMTSKATISHKAWAAFALSATFLLVFAFVGTQKIRERPATRARPATEEAAQTNLDKSSDEATEIADQAKDVAPQVWEPAPKTDDAPESTVKQLVQAWNQGNADKIAELFLSDGVLRLPPVRKLNRVRKSRIR